MKMDYRVHWYLYICRKEGQRKLSRYWEQDPEGTRRMEIQLTPSVYWLAEESVSDGSKPRSTSSERCQQRRERRCHFNTQNHLRSHFELKGIREAIALCVNAKGGMYGNVWPVSKRQQKWDKPRSNDQNRHWTMYLCKGGKENASNWLCAKRLVLVLDKWFLSSILFGGSFSSLRLLIW